MLDLLYAVRADEAGHRFANHTFANVQDHDFNPFSIKEPDAQSQSSRFLFDPLLIVCCFSARHSAGL